MWYEAFTDYAVGSLVLGVASYFIAKYKGLNPWLWFGIGTIGSLLGFLIVLLVKSKIAKK